MYHINLVNIPALTTSHIYYNSFWSICFHCKLTRYFHTFDSSTLFSTWSPVMSGRHEGFHLSSPSRPQRSPAWAPSTVCCACHSGCCWRAVGFWSGPAWKQQMWGRISGRSPRRWLWGRGWRADLVLLDAAAVAGGRQALRAVWVTPSGNLQEI